MVDCLIVFAKEPIEGKVKSRLAQGVGAQKALMLYRFFLLDVLQIAMNIKVDRRCIAYESFGKAPDFLNSFRQNFDMFRQVGSDLGARMTDAFESVFRQGCQRAIIIGSDSPTLPVEYVQKAFCLLKTCDVVWGPCQSGGFYLVGMRENVPQGIWDGIEWSTSRVLKRAQENAAALGKKVAMIEPWYDIDTAEDLKRLSEVGDDRYDPDF